MNCLVGWAPFSPYLYFKTAGFLFVGEAGVEWKTKIQFPHAVSRGDSSHVCLRPDFPGWGRQTATSRGKAVPCRRSANLGAARRPRTVQGNPAALPESSSSPGGRTKTHRNSLTFTADYRHGWQNPDWQTRARQGLFCGTPWTAALRLDAPSSPCRGQAHPRRFTGPLCLLLSPSWGPDTGWDGGRPHGPQPRLSARWEPPRTTVAGAASCPRPAPPRGLHQRRLTQHLTPNGARRLVRALSARHTLTGRRAWPRYLPSCLRALLACRPSGTGRTEAPGETTSPRAAGNAFLRGSCYSSQTSPKPRLWDSSTAALVLWRTMRRSPPETSVSQVAQVTTLALSQSSCKPSPKALAQSNTPQHQIQHPTQHPAFLPLP